MCRWRDSSLFCEFLEVRIDNWIVRKSDVYGEVCMRNEVWYDILWYGDDNSVG